MPSPSGITRSESPTTDATIFEVKLARNDAERMPRELLMAFEVSLMEVLEAAVGEANPNKPAVERKLRLLKFWGGVKTFLGLLVAIAFLVLLVRIIVLVAVAAWNLI